MFVLALDTNSSICAVCLWQDGVVVASAHEQMERGQDARLMPMVMAVMQQASASFDQLDRIAVTRGPGSFTGVRVCLAAARGIGIAASKPVIGINRFDIFRALHDAPKQDLLVVIQSKRVDLFCQFYPAMGATPEPCMMTEEQIAVFRTEHPDTLRINENNVIDENVIAMCASLAAQADAANPAYAPSPLYLRAPDVTLPSAKSR